MRWPASLQPSPVLRRVLPGLLAAIAAAELFAYAGYGSVERRMAADTLQLADRVREEDVPLRRTARDAAAASDRPVGEPDLTAFLKAVNAAATRAGVEVTRLAPRTDQTGLLDIELSARFPELLRFVAEAERLQGVFYGLQLRQPDAPTEPGTDRLAISFALEMPRHHDPDFRGTAPVTLDAAAHDPFAPPSAVDQREDRSAKHRLTGVTRVGSVLMATIDGRDYLEGDHLDDTVVATIREDGVVLAAGPLRYRLRFASGPG